MKSPDYWSYVVIVIITISGLALAGLIGREIFYAVKPDKRRFKRRRRKRRNAELHSESKGSEAGRDE